MDVPEPNAALEFWKALWEKTTVHNRDAEWIRSVEADLVSLTRQPNLHITLVHVQSCLEHMHNWKAPGNDMIHSFWWKKFSSLHSRLPGQLQEILNGSIPMWLVRGRTTLIQKVKSKGPVPSNYRPITCLPTILKLLTSILTTVVRKYLADNT